MVAIVFIIEIVGAGGVSIDLARCSSRKGAVDIGDNMFWYDVFEIVTDLVGAQVGVSIIALAKADHGGSVKIVVEESRGEKHASRDRDRSLSGVCWVWDTKGRKIMIHELMYHVVKMVVKWMY